MESRLRPLNGYFAPSCNAYTSTQHRQWGIVQGTQGQLKTDWTGKLAGLHNNISQLWMSLSCEQIATETLKKSFNLLNCYQEDVECEYSNVQAPFPPSSASIHSIIIYLSLIFNRYHYF